eukprot:scaffold22602_cov154-Cylindrotheca_fusiformis.AAC.10
MKLSCAFLSLLVSATTSTAAAARSLSPSLAAKLLRNARRLDQNNQEEDEFAYLTKYTLKFVGCDASQQMVNQEDGGYSYGAAMLRLCPSDNGCDSDSVGGCKEGYGDFFVSIEDYVDAYFEDQADNMNWDDNFDGDKYAKCEEYEPENDGDDDPYENYQFYIGPTCTEDGDGIKLGFFMDETCTTVSSFSFGEVSNGWTLPYSSESGGLVATKCLDCLEYDEDQGGYELRDMCMELYENAPMKCESKMEYYSQYGKQEGSCEQIDELLPRAAKPGGGAGKVFGWILFVLLIVGIVGYVMWWRKKKQASGAADGMLA